MHERKVRQGLVNLIIVVRDGIGPKINQLQFEWVLCLQENLADGLGPNCPKGVLRKVNM
jgi:hypothetical protein